MLTALGRKKEEITADNAPAYLRRFARGKAWRDDRTKALIWELYQYERSTVTVSRESLNPAITRRLLDFIFQKPEDPYLSLEGLSGKFLIYKRAIKHQENLVVRGYIEFRPDDEGRMECEEIHINRSQRDASPGSQLGPPKETWLGTILPRRRAYCMITVEEERGTPKFATLSILHSESKKIMSLRGSSIECIEAWGDGPGLASGIYLERINDEFNVAEDKDLIDLVTVEELRQNKPEVVRYLGL